MLNLILKDLRDKKGLSQVKMAQELNVSQSRVASWETGTRRPSNEMLEILSDYFEVSTDYLLGRDGKSKYAPKKKSVKIPVLGVIPAGVPIEAIEEIIDYEEITEEEAKKGEYFGLLVKGDSMFPTLLENDVVIVRKQESAESNDVCAVLVNGYDATLKRIRRLNTGVVLVPDNKSYEEKTYSNADILNMPVRILGRVIEVRRKM